jgi:hypothetical protein
MGSNETVSYILYSNYMLFISVFLTTPRGVPTGTEEDVLYLRSKIKK